MMDFLIDILPASLDHLSSAILIAVSFIGSFITAAMGIGGGIVVLATIATLLPPAAVIPVHGVVQVGSNFGRSCLLARDIDWATFAYFFAGALVGIAIGGSIVITLPGEILRGGLACFILYLVWAPKPRFVGQSQIVVLAVGLGASILTMFFGATGPFISSVLSQRGYEPRQMVATHSAAMTMQHLLKVIAFGLLGFAFADYVGLIVLMLIVGFAGTYLGSLVLNRLPKAVFAKGLKGILTILALNLLAIAFGLYGS